MKKFNFLFFQNFLFKFYFSSKQAHHPPPSTDCYELTNFFLTDELFVLSYVI